MSASGLGVTRAAVKQLKRFEPVDYVPVVVGDDDLHRGLG
jgi:hypothetical protein